MKYKKIAVYCASSNNISGIYLDAAYKLGTLLAGYGCEIVYGGGNIGLMGNLAEGALSRKGKVIGVIPDFLMDLELGHKGIHRLERVGSLHERQLRMMSNSDCIMALPGGCGTFLELMEAITWKKLGRIISPIVIININGYFNEIIGSLNKAIDEGFMRKEHSMLWQTAESVESAVGLLYKDYDVQTFDIV